MLQAARPVFWDFRNCRVFVAQIPLICTICFIDLEEQKERARVHFIPDLMVGVFVTLCAPDVIKSSIQHLLDGRLNLLQFLPAACKIALQDIFPGAG